MTDQLETDLRTMLATRASDINQVSIFVEPEQQGPKAQPGRSRLRPASDHRVNRGCLFDLHPRIAASFAIKAVGALSDDSFEPIRSGQLIQLFALLHLVIGKAHMVRRVQ